MTARCGIGASVRKSGSGSGGFWIVFAASARVLSQFPLQEPLRLAPEYDFSMSPQPGRLYYENFDWGVDGRAWREKVRDAFRDLELPCVC